MAVNYWEAGHRIRLTLGDAPIAGVTAVTGGVPIQVGTKAMLPIRDGVTGDCIAFASSGVWAFEQADPGFAYSEVVNYDPATNMVVAPGTGFELGTYYEYEEGKACVKINDEAYPHYQP